MTTSSTPEQASALHRIEIPSPCTASWDAMQGNEQVRHCGLCKKNVFNLSAMPEAEAAALLASNIDGNLCVRFYRRGDGTVMTSDCGAGVPVQVRRTLGKAPLVAGAAALALAAAGANAGNDGPPLMGAPPATPYQAQTQPVPSVQVIETKAKAPAEPVAPMLVGKPVMRPATDKGTPPAQTRAAKKSQ